MDKLFIFAIGGTGSRVLKALTHLLAAGVDINARIVVPIIIDTDAAGGNMGETIDLLNHYRAIRNQLADTDTANTTFFKTRIATLGELAGNAAAANQYVMNIGGNTNMAFATYFSLATLGAANKALINMLYSTDEQNENMNVGFKGHPNMGCAVLNQFVGNAQFNSFANAFTPGDGIFIISSIFGGTGASGFPLLLKNIRGAAAPTPNHAALQAAPVGAVSVLPYFNLPNNPGYKIKSDTFITKTKAALNYYKDNLNGIDSLYYVKDTPGQAYQYDEGGAGQLNEAHIVELISALAVIDFAAHGQHLPGVATYKDFATQTINSPVKLDDFFPDTYHITARPMTEFTLFCKFMAYELQNATTQSWYAENTPDFNTLIGTGFWGHLTAFTACYLEWMEQMAHYGTGLAPFVLDDLPKNVFGFVHGKGTKKVASLASNWALYEVYLNHVSKANCLNRQNGSNEGCFVAILCEATRKIVADKIKL